MIVIKISFTILYFMYFFSKKVRKGKYSHCILSCEQFQMRGAVVVVIVW